jgi:hypothetical protein
MEFKDKDRVTPIKLKDYIDFIVMPKERDMMRKNWRLPGHPGFIAVSGLEMYVRPVVHLWCEQSLQAELEALRDAKLRTKRAQQPLSQQQQPSSYIRQTKPTINDQKSSQSQKEASVPINRILVKAAVSTAISTSPTLQQAQSRVENGEKSEKVNKAVEIEESGEIDNRNSDESKGDEKDCGDRGYEDYKRQDKDGVSENFIPPEKGKTLDNRFTDKVNQDSRKDNLSCGEALGAAPLSAALLASSTFLPAGPPTSPPQRLPPASSSSQPPGLMSQNRTKDAVTYE